MNIAAVAGRYAAVLDEAESRFDELAARAGGATTFTFTVAGRCVRLRSAGPELVRTLSRSFAHLETPDATPDLTILLWDSASTGAPEPVTADLDARELWRDGRRRAVGQGPEGWFNAVDPDRRLAVGWVRDATKLAYWDVASPLRLVFGWWLPEVGRAMVHAGAVGRPDGGVLLVGRGGSGKSTCALSCLEWGDLSYVSDDYTVLSLDEEAALANSLYGSGKVDAAQVERLPFLRPTIWNANRLETEKATVFVNEDFPDRMVGRFPVRCVVVPRITGDRSDSTFRRIPSGMALAALAPSTVLQITGSGQEAFAPLRELLERVPSYVLELGTDVPTIPSVLERLLDEVAA